MKAIDICKQNIPVAKSKYEQARDRISREHPDIVEFARCLGSYAGMRVRVDGETIFEWRKKQDKQKT